MTIFRSIADAFSRDGAVTRFTEKIPVVGLVTAAVQGIAGNGEHAKRALANQANSIITTAGTMGGFVVGGPVGAVAGGAFASSLGIAAEYGVSTTIKDDEVKGNTGDTSLKRFVTDAALSGAGGLIGVGSSSAVVKQVGTGFSKGLLTQAEGTVMKATIGAVIGQSAQGVINTVKSRGPNQPEPTIESPPKDDPNSELIRAVSTAQAASGRKWISTVRKLEEFSSGKFHRPINQNNLAPGSNISNITRNFSSLPGLLNVDVDYLTAWPGLQSYLDSVTSKLTGPGSKGRNLCNALYDVITNHPDLKAEQKDEIREALGSCVMNIEIQTAKTRTIWLEEVHMIPRSSLVPANLAEYDL